MIKFSDIKFEPHPIMTGVIARVNGCSIIRGPFSYGGREGLYEVMDRDGEVHGHLTPGEVEDIIN